MLIGDDAGEMNGTVEHNDSDPERCPVGFLYRGDDTVANMIGVGCGIRNIARQPRNGLKQVGARHYSDKFVSAHNRTTLDVVAFHQLYNVFERGVLRHGVRLRGHDLPNLAAPLMNEVGRGPAGPDQELQPSAAFSLGADLGAADKVALRDDADQPSGFIDHRKSTDVIPQHAVCCVDDRSVDSDGYNLSCHDLMCAHFTIS